MAFEIVVAAAVMLAAVSLVVAAAVNCYSNFAMELQFADVVALIEFSSFLVLESNTKKKFVYIKLNSLERICVYDVVCSSLFNFKTKTDDENYQLNKFFIFAHFKLFLRALRVYEEERLP